MVLCCDAYGGCGTCLLSFACPCVVDARTAAMLDERECSVCDACCLTAYGTRQV
jgi:hypothetical protein